MKAICGTLLVVGFLLVLGVVGGVERGADIDGGTILTAAVGLAMMGICAFAISRMEDE